MKNIKKIFGIIAILSVIALSFSSCDLGDEGDDGVPKRLKITGITNTLGGTAIPTTGKIAVGIADVSKKGKANLVAYGEVGVAADVDVALISNKNLGEQYTGTGSYFVILIFDSGTSADTDDINCAFTGSVGGSASSKTSITEATTTLPFNQFTVITNN